MHRILSLVLAITMCCSLPFSVFAESDSEAEPEVTVEKVEIDFSDENVPSVNVTVTPGTTDSGSVDASDVVDEAVKEAVEQVKSELPAEGYVDNEDGTPMFTKEEIDMLTPGLALTVTQAAIWQYGNSGKDSYKVNDESIIGSGSVFTSRYYSSIKVTNKTDDVLAFEEANNKNLSYAPEESAISDATIAMAQKLFEHMLKGKSEATDDTTAITENNAFESATITVNNQVVDDLNALAESAPKNYNVDVAFTLGVVPGEGDSMVVEVYQLDESGNVVMKDGAPVVLSSVPVETNKTDYTIKGLELPNGSSITLNLNGVNHLDSGVYLYSAVSFRDSQTMIGYASGDQAVDLNVNLTFNVSDPELTKKRQVR